MKFIEKNAIFDWFNIFVFSFVLAVLISFQSCTSRAASIDETFRDALKWKDVRPARTLSDIGLVSMYVYPVVLTLDESNIGGRLLTLGSAHALNAGLTKLVKVTTNRLRPDESDSRSFYSGHASAAFTSAGYICRYEKSHCGVALIVAGSTGYLRIAAGRHWLSDVLVGAAAGYATGHAIPIYFKGF